MMMLKVIKDDDFERKKKQLMKSCSWRWSPALSIQVPACNHHQVITIIISKFSVADKKVLKVQMCSLCFILPVFWDINVLNVFLRLCFGVGETFLGWFWSGAVVVTQHFGFLFATKFLSGKVFACFSLNQGPDNIKVLLWLQKRRQILEIILEKKLDKPAFVNKKCDGDTFKERLCWNFCTSHRQHL